MLKEICEIIKNLNLSLFSYYKDHETNIVPAKGKGKNVPLINIVPAGMIFHMLDFTAKIMQTV